ncbi:hypothetical protein BAE30_04165 [Acidithiobacillus caldus]|uniref:Uncharacterized protein n=1 Tax=Acidithiobacillus caldus TaxID=33059 RepID=A0A1E7YYU9_9PROT|nr:hypothetical protein BAE30_04165 [Acidithiobacillus caldus]
MEVEGTEIPVDIAKRVIRGDFTKNEMRLLFFFLRSKGESVEPEKLSQMIKMPRSSIEVALQGLLRHGLIEISPKGVKMIEDLQS